MITLITGGPGSGKTAHAVDMLLDMVGKRPIFSDGVPGLVIEHQPVPPVPEWTIEAPDASSATGKKISFTFPPNSIVIIDECQRVFRPRSSGSRVPPEVAAFETHRHLGIDFILITQHPSLVDGNIRRLVYRHIHIKTTAFGRYRFEWAEIGDPDSRASRDCAARSKYKLPKRAFSQYKSAELHTKTKIKLPMAVYIFGGALLSLGAAGWYIKGSIAAKLEPEKGSNVAKLTAQPGHGPGKPGAVITATSTPAEYAAAYTPRLTGLPHTAPAYDKITEPADAPVPVGCIERPKTGECKCWDQQGNTYRTTPAVCVSFIQDGMFIPWRVKEATTVPAGPQAVQGSAPGTPFPPTAHIGHSYGSGVGQLQGESHNFAGGFTAEPKRQEPTYTLRPAG